MLKYIPYVLMFAVATMIIYGWGLWRTMHQKQDLSNMLCSKGISKVKKALKKNKSLTKKELEPFVKDLTAKQPFNSERIGVTDPNAFLDSILPYMLKQKMIKEIREDKSCCLSVKQITDRQLFLIACSTQRSFSIHRIKNDNTVRSDRSDQTDALLPFFYFCHVFSLILRSYYKPRRNIPKAC